MMRLHLLLLVLWSNYAFATTYYVSILGNNTDGTTPAKAWQTISKLNSSSASIQPGDSVLFNRGETFFGPLIISRSGTSSAPIVFGSFGDVNLKQPLITTLTKVTGWSNQGGNIWRAPFVFAGMLQTVVIDNRIRAMGQWPDADSLGTGGYPTAGYRFVTSRDTSSPYTYIKDNLLDFSHRAQDLRTGQVVIRTNNTNISVANVTSIGSDNQTINFTATPEDLPPSFAYFFRNAKSTLTKQYEWYFNDAKDSLYVYSTTAPTNVQVSTIDNCLKLNNVSYVVVDGITFYGSDGELAVFTGGTKNTIKNCSLKYAGSNGIHINSSSTWAKVSNTSVQQSCNSGVVFSGPDAVVENGDILLSGWMPGMGSGGNGQYSGVSERGDRATLIGCSVDSSGQHGDTFGRDGTKVINNFFNHSGLVLSDAGDVYTAAPNWVKTRYPNKRIISGNIMMNGMGAKEGTSSWNSPTKLGSHHGIYFDGGTTDVIIENNTIYNMPWRAVYVNQSSNLVFRNNKFLNYTTISYQDTKSAWPIDSIIFQNNLCVAIGSKTSSSIEYASNRATTSIKYAWSPADVNTNKYYNVLVPLSTTQMLLKGTGTSLPTWRSSLRSDANSSLGPVTLTDTSSTNSYKVLVNPSDTAKTFTLDGKTWLGVSGVPAEDNISYTRNTATVAPHRSLFLVRTPAVPLDNGTNVAPTITLNTPTNNQQFTSPATVSLTATASDPDGSVAKVDFYNGNTLLFSDNAAPYSYSWTNVAAGPYNLSAKATDNLGLVTASSTVPILVNAPPSAPVVTLTSPANNASFVAGGSVDMSATASTATGTITKVDFYSGPTLLFSDATSPYAYTWPSIVAGTYSITAKATNSAGLTTTSGAVTITVVPGNNPPSVTLTSPLNNATYTAPASVQLSATASDADGTVSKVDFYNGSTLIASDATSPYSFSWTNVAAGSYNITAKATDNSGATTTSSVVSITVGAPVFPSVSLSSPVNNATYIAPATIDITANASSANSTISRVDFYNGTTLLGTDVTSPYTYSWTGVTSGTYSITAKATDNNNLTSTSGAVSVTVNNPPANVAPTISLTSPTTGTQYTAPATINIAATASDADGSVAKVDFYNGSTLLFSDATSPYSFTWSSVPVGNYSITAKATDNSGAVTSSSVAAVTVNPAPVAPNVALTSPANNSTYISPATISIAATASDPDGTISKVDFFNGNVLLASDATAPYTFIWSGVGAGTYSITARATDNSGLTATSGIVNAVVNTPANQTPSASITSPVNNASFTQPVNITINATAADADGTIKSVDFYSGATLLGSDVTAPYSYTWNGVPAGNYSLTVVATDNANAQATSNPVNISVVAPNVLPSVAIVAPVTGAQYISPATINISATASDTDGFVSSVKFFNGTTLLATVTNAPYTFSWTAVPAGSYTITAVATDNSGATKTSAPVNVSVRNLVAPAATITSPANNLTYLSPATFAVNVSASDPDGRVVKVELYNGATLVGTDTSSPYNYSVSGLPKGAYQLTAKAYDDDNLVTTSPAINIVVNNPKIPPTIFISTPPNNSAYTDPAAITMGATANDQDGVVVRVDFFNGTTLIASDYTAPYTLTWSSVMAGNYSIIARAIDNDSLTTASAPIAVTVTHINVPPSVEMIIPATNDSAYETESVTLAAGARDNDGTITKVEFYANDSLIDTETKLPYEFVWSNLVEGQYIIKAKAYDNSGAATVSQPITFRVVKKPYPIRGHEIIIVQ